MTDSKHTPGPWLNKAGTSAVFTESGVTVCEVHFGSIPDAEAEANARLISAAPDMLEALNEIRDMLWSRPDISDRLRPLMGFAEELTNEKARPAKFSNPFKVGYTGIPDRETAVALFRSALLIHEYLLSAKPWLAALLSDEFGGLPTGMDIQDELAGKDLACWCSLDQPCHADILLKLANQK